MVYYVTTENLPIKTSQWLNHIAPFNTHRMSMNLDRSALMVIDMQNFFLNPDSPSFTCGGLAIIPNISHLIQEFRHYNRPVIYTRHVHHPHFLDAGIMAEWWEGMCKEGTPESEIHSDLTPLTEEKVILKHRYSAFYNTDLETILRCLKIEDIVITGIMTNMCCESTTRDAYYRDYRTFFLADATGSISEEMHVGSLLNLAFGFSYVCSTSEILQSIENKH